MSHKSSLQAHARYSVAISVLNRLRHWLIGREGAGLRKDDQDILLESLELSESRNLSEKMVLYSFQAFGNHEHSAALELSDALNKALEIIGGDRGVAASEAFKKALESGELESLDQAEKESAVELVTKTMYVLDAQEDAKPRSPLAPKDL
ncbi:MAG: hypothetical protein M3441_21790 [Chloroflexota bacterium]|nr:hypothetical protein [Chloroflexota bacterium]